MTLVFYDQKWVEIGTKSSLEKLISSITRIRNINRWEDASIAQKMSCEFVHFLFTFRLDWYKRYREFKYT